MNEDKNLEPEVEILSIFDVPEENPAPEEMPEETLVPENGQEEALSIEEEEVSEEALFDEVSESVKLAQLSDRENVKAHVDFYHMMQNGEKLSDLAQYVPFLGHVHIASPVKRTVPTFDDGATVNENARNRMIR